MPYMPERNSLYSRFHNPEVPSKRDADLALRRLYDKYSTQVPRKVAENWVESSREYVYLNLTTMPLIEIIQNVDESMRRKVEMRKFSDPRKKAQSNSSVMDNLNAVSKTITTALNKASAKKDQRYSKALSELTELKNSARKVNVTKMRRARRVESVKKLKQKKFLIRTVGSIIGISLLIALPFILEYAFKIG